MKLIQTLSLIGSLTLTLAVSACGTKSSSNNDAPAPTPPIPLTGPSFATDVNPILVQNCAPCHNPGSSIGGFIGDEAQVKAFAAGPTGIAARIQATDKTQMPLQRKVPPPLTATQKATFLAYLQQAAGAGPLTFAKDIKPITDAECVSCHAAGNKRKLPEVGTEAALADKDLAAAVASKISTTDMGEIMPPVNRTLTAAQKQTILTYLGVTP